MVREGEVGGGGQGRGEMIRIGRKSVELWKKNGGRGKEGIRDGRRGGGSY